MTKRFFAIILAMALLSPAIIFAGDVAQYVDIGFSPDGKTYAFANYGVADKTLQAYAEIYAVDVKKNDFLAGGVFKTVPSSSTAHKNGKDVYASLLEKNRSFFSKNAIPSLPNSKTLYLAAAETSKKTQIEFRDFENSTIDNPVSYAIRLTELVEGSGTNTQSSFYLIVEKKDGEGKVLARTLCGNPQIKRKAVTGYKIVRVLSDNSGKNLVFVVEKTLAEASGTSIRYMVETLSL